MTLQDLASRTGLSAGFLSKIENGIGNPSVNNIQKICYALDITVNELMMSKQEEKLLSTVNEHDSYVLRSPERCLLYNFSNAVRFESLFEGSPHFKLNVMTLAGRTEPPFHTTSTHSYDEFGVVAKGRMLIQLADQAQYELAEGDCIMIRARTPHTVTAISPEECVSFWVEISEKSSDSHFR